MDETRACPTCKSPIPADAPGAACPRCLMAIAFATDAGAMVPDVAPGEVVERFPAYEVLGAIGRGGMGVVFRARQKALDREVALKVLPGGPSRPAGFTERFEREAKALARLQHPGIVQVFDFGTSPDGWCFLAMELVEGANLRRALADGRLAPKEALAIVPQICDALQYAHDRGVVHRDIKPENVLLTPDGRVKIADFGLAKLMEDARGASLTATGHSMGTPLYMAPEQVEHPGDVDHRADIYSLGVVFYEMLTGELPIGRFAPPSKKSDVDARIDDIVLRTLEKEREARFQRVAEVKTRIDEASGQAAAPREAPVAARAAPPETRSRVSRLAVAVAFAPLAVALIAVAAWSANGGKQPDQRLGWAGMWTGSAAFAGVVLGLVAWGRIRHSGGAVHGRWFAALGLAGSAASVLALVPLYVWENARLVAQGGARGGMVGRFDPSVRPSRPMPPEPRVVDGVEIAPGIPDEMVAETVHGPAIRKLVGRAQALWPPRDSSSWVEVYDAQDAALLDGMTESDRGERSDAGALGLPLASIQFLGASLREFGVERVEVDWGRTRAWVVLRRDGRRIVADLERASSGDLVLVPWRFVLGPVREAEPAAAPAPIGGSKPPK